MGYVMICDLCKQPLYSKAYGSYKIKKEWSDGWGHGWVILECHDECVRKLLEATSNPQDVK